MNLVNHSRISGSPDELFEGGTATIDGKKVRIKKIGSDYTLGDPADAAIELSYEPVAGESGDD